MGKQKESQFSGVVTTRNRKVTVNLFVIQFQDDGNIIAYCPALNIYGYGKTEEDSRNSFEICLAEFFDYTIAKKTLVQELETLGWQIKKERKFTAPDFSQLLSSDRDLRKIMNTKSFVKIDRSFTIPAFS